MAEPGREARQPPAPRWPLVSVVVPTRDRPQGLQRAVEAIVGQRYAGEVECLVVFDRQAPVPPVVDLPERRELRLLSNQRTPGPAGARNTGVLAARGELIAFCDDDDEWHADKLRLQVESLDRSDWAVVATCGITLRAGARRFARLPSGDKVGLDELMRSRRTDVHTSTLVAWRQRLLDDVGLIDETIPAGYGEDYDWLLRAAAVAPLVAVGRPLVDVNWDGSWFADRWPTIIAALTYQLERRPELREHPSNLARIQGRLAFAYAATGDAVEARRWAKKALAADWRQPRGYLALLVSRGLVKPETVVRAGRLVGRGI